MLRPAEELGGAASLASAIRETNGRAIVGFKPGDRARGVEDGRRLLDAAAVDSLVERFTPCVIEEVLHRYGIIPAVSARIRPDRVGWLLADPRVDYVEPDRVVELEEGIGGTP